MSRGPGHVERKLMAALSPGGFLWSSYATVSRIAARIYEVSEADPTPSQRVSVNRALRSLARKGAPIEWCHFPDTGVIVWFHKEAVQNADEDRSSQTGRKQSGRRSTEKRRLAKILGMLGSEHDGEVLAAARQLEALRRKRGMTWGQMIDDSDTET